jgi:hypothetical protein
VLETPRGELVAARDPAPHLEIDAPEGIDRPDLRPVRQDAPLEPGHRYLEEVDGALGARVDAPEVGLGDNSVAGDRGIGDAEAPEQMYLTPRLRTRR